MKVLFVSSECAPFIKTGGLADVVGALPKSLRKKDVDARVILPKYSAIAEKYRNEMQRVADLTVYYGGFPQQCGIDMLTLDGVPFYFVDSDTFFNVSAIYGDGPREGHRFAFFCRAVIDCLWFIDFVPDVMHLNDWQTGLIAALLKTQYQNSAVLRSVRTVFSIHNLRYQGLFGWRELADPLGLDGRLNSPDYLEYFGMISCMKAGLVFADRVSTVSPSYAQEICTPFFGEGLDGVLRGRGNDVRGILNGIDTESYDPQHDKAIAKNFTYLSRKRKQINKNALQQEVGLPVRSEVPLIGFISRLAPQKGLDLIARVLEDILRMELQLFFLGSGDADYTDMINDVQRRHPDKVACYIGFNEPLSRRVYAGSDMFLMPSQFEPCGLSQMIALRYGSIPIVRETGGLKDSIRPYNQYTDEGNGFSFTNYNAHEMLYCIEHAVHYYYDDPLMWDRLVRRAMRCDFSWNSSADRYIDLYHGLLNK